MEFAKTLAPWVDPGHLHSTPMTRPWQLQTASTFNENILVIIKFYELINGLFKGTCVPSIQPNSCGIPNFTSNFNTIYLISCVFLGRYKYFGPKISFIALKNFRQRFRNDALIYSKCIGCHP